MDSLWIFLFAFITQWAPFFSFSLTLFRQDIWKARHKILFSSILMCYVTYWVQTYNQALGITFVQPVSAFLCFLVIFRLRFTHAAVVFTLSYLYNVVAEACVYVVTSRITGNSFIQLAHDEFVMPSIVVAAFMVIGIFILRKTRIGFSFVPFQRTRNSNQQQLLRSVPRAVYYCLDGAFLLCVSIFFIQSKISVVTGFVSLVLFYFYYIYFLYNKEMSE
ncbi:hypothetical protein [Paenibacillus mucilaginosus]|uniref:Uncharacterized protein n=1 Tax=Paenibacillus mucilaginosus (strain KNP414) TaxID=1036673 RepID=F8FNJ0_PAEMK|nr:hypothetical protein [Paenibacillus mucilaginosus]AEI40102.1 hypothetical protein KNP414_01538 [Paenibacillus mucilaginosus KNP414]MCG7215707.1 hypothetical protein [Paenibacillus mucilaginosus]WDM29340.1 hypothetical protein KCX80_09350 [Paenibacillus mucilaginosus]